MIADANSKGVIQEKNQVAINLLKEKMPYDLISKVTGLTAEEIKKIEKNMNQE
ncbi:unknown [Firmicutes bacterium CAG:884]|nr:unknown [Firmicutes bacterium CAG:884]